MASDQVITLSHVVAAGLGVALIASVGRSLAHNRRTRVRTEDAVAHRRCLRTLARLIGHLLRGTERLAVTLGLALVTPVGLLCANGRYPLVAPVLASFEARLAVLGHRTGHARCFPLLVGHVWLVRCAGCHRRCFFREVPAAGGTGVDLKALGASPWRARRCPAEYLTAQPIPTERSTQPAVPARRGVRPARAIPAVQQPVVASPSLPRPPSADKTA